MYIATFSTLHKMPSDLWIRRLYAILRRNRIILHVYCAFTATVYVCTTSIMSEMKTLWIFLFMPLYHYPTLCYIPNTFCCCCCAFLKDYLDQRIKFWHAISTGSPGMPIAPSRTYPNRQSTRLPEMPPWLVFQLSPAFHPQLEYKSEFCDSQPIIPNRRRPISDIFSLGFTYARLTIE